MGGRGKYKNNLFEGLFSDYDFSDLPEYVVPIASKNIQEVSDTSKFLRVIALDETGSFEHLWDDGFDDKEDVRCIGGVYVDIPLKEGASINERINNTLHRELCKINQFFNESIDIFNNHNENYRVIMPDSLHFSNILLLNKDTGEKYYKFKKNENKDTSKKRNLIRNNFKSFIEKRVIDYLNENNYRIYSYILSKEQIDTNNINKSNLLDFRIGANLYEEMVIKAIENLVFYDVSKTIDTVSLRMATRIFFPDSDEAVLYDVLKKNGKNIGYITNTNFIKTALMHKVASDSIEKNLYATFAVESIDYKKTQNITDDMWKERQELLSFHYLADIVCGILRQKYGYEKNGVLRADFEKNLYESSIVDKSYNLVDLGYNIRFISDADKMYNQMVDYINVGNLVGYYSLKYDYERRIRSKNSKIRLVSKYYYDTLLPNLDDGFLKYKLTKEKDYKNKIINILPKLYSMNNGYMGMSENKYEKGMYIAFGMCYVLKCLEDVIQSEDYKQKYVFRFNDIIVRGYNHRGAINEILPFLDKCDKAGAYVGVEEYIEHKQRSIQVYFNSLDYDYIINEYYKNVIGSYKDGRWNFSNIENMIDSMRVISGKETQGYLLVGKIKGTLAQALAFKRLKNAELYFKQALDEMRGDKGNTSITLSYLLHHYCDMASKYEYDVYKKKFEEGAISYFNITSDTIDVKALKNTFDIIKNTIEKNSELRFSLYLFVKAIKVFYIPVFKEDDEFISFISDLSSGIIEHSKKLNDLIHPWELIYKNMYEILDELENKDKSYYYERIIDENRMKSNGPTIAAIIILFKLDIIEDYKINDLEQKKLKELKLDANFESITTYELKEILRRRLTYMYN